MDLSLMLRMKEIEDKDRSMNRRCGVSQLGTDPLKEAQARQSAVIRAVPCASDPDDVHSRSSLPIRCLLLQQDGLVANLDSTSAIRAISHR